MGIILIVLCVSAFSVTWVGEEQTRRWGRLEESVVLPYPQLRPEQAA